MTYASLPSLLDTVQISDTAMAVLVIDLERGRLFAEYDRLNREIARLTAEREINMQRMQVLLDAEAKLINARKEELACPR